MKFLFMNAQRWLKHRVMLKKPLPHNIIDGLRQNLSFAHYRKPVKAMDAAVLIAITDEAEPKVLFTKRAMHLNSHRGEVSFPGGKRDLSDTSNIVVALREAHEEVGLNPHHVELLGELPVVRSKAGLTVKAIVGLIPPDTHLVAQPSEIDRIFFVPLSYFLQHNPIEHQAKLNGKSYHVPAYQYDGEIIWGLTGMLLVNMLGQGLHHLVYWPLVILRRKRT